MEGDTTKEQAQEHPPDDFNTNCHLVYDLEGVTTEHDPPHIDLLDIDKTLVACVITLVSYC